MEKVGCTPELTITRCHEKGSEAMWKNCMPESPVIGEAGHGRLPSSQGPEEFLRQCPHVHEGQAD